MTRPRTVLICHHDAPLHIEGVARWMASWSVLRGIVIIEEPAGLFWRRVRRERSGIGLLRLFYVLAFQLWYRIRWAARDAAWREATLRELQSRYPQLTGEVPILRVRSPNAPEIAALHRDRPSGGHPGTLQDTVGRTRLFDSDARHVRLAPRDLP